MDFLSALDTKAEEIEKPANLPQGTYTWMVSKVPSTSVSGNGEWNIVEFPIRVVAADTDVDEDELEVFGPVDGVMNRISFMAPTDPDKKNEVERALWNIRQFLERTLKVDAEDGATLKEMMDAALNCQFLGQAVHEPRKNDPETIDVRVKNYAPLD